MQITTRPDLTESHMIQYYWFAMAARIQEEHANDVKRKARERVKRQSPNADEGAVRDMTNKTPLVQNAIADQQFYSREGVLHGIGAILEEQQRTNDLLEEILTTLRAMPGLGDR